MLPSASMSMPLVSRMPVSAAKPLFSGEAPAAVEPAASVVSPETSAKATQPLKTGRGQRFLRGALIAVVSFVTGGVGSAVVGLQDLANFKAFYENDTFMALSRGLQVGRTSEKDSVNIRRESISQVNRLSQPTDRAKLILQGLTDPDRQVKTRATELIASVQNENLRERLMEVLISQQQAELDSSKAERYQQVLANLRDELYQPGASSKWDK